MVRALRIDGKGNLSQDDSGAQPAPVQLKTASLPIITVVG